MDQPTEPIGSTGPSLRVVSAISAVAGADWDACTGEVESEGRVYNPFICHAFLKALEDSKSTGGRSGWSPAYLLAEAPDGALLGAAPSFLKSHSQGEYVFDHAFADALERAGGHYYPKVQVSAPFTPATGPRLLVRPGTDSGTIRTALLRGLLALMGDTDASSVHLTFLSEEEQGFVIGAGLGFLPRLDIQYHWIDEGFGDFDGFLAAFSARKRKVVKRERRDALAGDIAIRWITGGDLTEAHWDAFWRFYQDTGSRKWGRPYLTRAFFSRIGEVMPEKILLVMAERAGRYVAGALNFIGEDTLYGRYWGCVEDHPFLHFEVCYHQAIEFALAHGLKRVEAGAQGQHKLARGYRPVLTRSAHAFADPRLAHAVAGYLDQERAQIIATRDALDAETPFKAA